MKAFKVSSKGKIEVVEVSGISRHYVILSAGSPPIKREGSEACYYQDEESANITSDLLKSS